MNQAIKSIVLKYWKNELSKEVFLREIQQKLGGGEEQVKKLFDQIFQNQDNEGLEFALTILYTLEQDNEMIDIIHRFLLAPWHSSYEELAHDLQRRKQPDSIPYLKEAMQKKFSYLESYETGTRQFINQCGHALVSIGTKEAIEVIYDLSKSEDPIIKDEMLYRLSRIEGRNDYERNY